MQLSSFVGDLRGFSLFLSLWHFFPPLVSSLSLIPSLSFSLLRCPPGTDKIQSNSRLSSWLLRMLTILDHSTLISHSGRELKEQPRNMITLSSSHFKVREKKGVLGISRSTTQKLGESSLLQETGGKDAGGRF